MHSRVDVLTIGESLGCLRTASALQPGSDLRASIAGAESNVAIGLARLGHSVTWSGVVGLDTFGDLIVRTLRAEGVNPTVRSSALQTGIIVFKERLPAVTTVDYFRHGSAGSSLDSADVDRAFAVAVPDILHVTGITPALSSSARDAVEHAVAQAREWGSRVCLDINYRSRLWSRREAREVLAPLARAADIVIASDDELDLALEAPPEPLRDQVSALLEHSAEVIVKHGADGATGFTTDTELHEPVRPVPTVDALGACDAVVAGYLSALSDGLYLAARLARGASMGAFAVASRGDWEGLPKRDELELLALSPGDALR